MRVSLFYFWLFLKRMGIALVMFMLCRIIFYLANRSLFPDAGIYDFIIGIRYDLSAIGWIFAPFFFFQLFPIPLRKSKKYDTFLRALFHISNTICLIFNLIDVKFYSFTLKRTTADIIDLVTTGDDFLTLLPQFFADYWPYVLVFSGLIFLTDWLYRMSRPARVPEKHHFLFQFSLFIIGVVIVGVASRGGFQLRPLNVISINQYVSLPQIPLALNTPFTFMKSLTKTNLKELSYYEEAQLDHIFSPVLFLHPEKPFTDKNVVIIILESFSKEYIGGYTGNHTYTPFLDSLMGHSTVFTNAFANGKRSIEALPAIFSGLPNLMEAPYITSSYASNEVGSLGAILKKKGYHTSFFHGGSNGTMGFDAFAAAASMNHYYGRDEYGDEEEFDGNWGIFDEPFFNYFGQQLHQLPQPFFTTLFSLSSHHPYTIPEKYKGVFPTGKLAIHESVGYTDMALRKFFEKVKHEPWFKKSLFLITADHTAQSAYPYFKNTVGTYAIPMLLYTPQNDRAYTVSNYTQHADISTIILDQLHFNGSLFSYGKNPMKADDRSLSINFNNGIYQLIMKDYCLQFDGQRSIALYHLPSDSLLQNNVLTKNTQQAQNLERTLKAILQSYHYRMIHNQLTIRNE